MKLLDRAIQSWRIGVAGRHLAGCGRVVDVGAHRGELFAALGGSLKEGFGIEPLLDRTITGAGTTIVPGWFPEVRPPTPGWDAVALIAVLEHIPREKHEALAAACFEILRTGGRVVVTVPGRAVDNILAVMKGLRLVDGMSIEEHYGFQPSETTRVFQPPRFKLLAHSRFQLGLNHLFVFETLAWNS